jgi:AcrR family transcriptional regulator
VRLIETVLELRKTQPYEAITVENVLEISGISRGSLYHHFADFYDLIEAAEIARFTKYVDVSIQRISDMAAAATSREELVRGVQQITRETQSPAMHQIRMDRIAALARSQGNPRFQRALAAEQERLTQALSDLVVMAQRNGWFDKALTPRAVAVFIQSYTLGRALDEISQSETDPEEWNRLIDRVVEMAFFTQNPAN